MKRDAPRPRPSSDTPSGEDFSRHVQWGAPLVVPRDPQTDVPAQDSGELSSKKGPSGDRLVQLYLREASATPLLTLEEERRLAALNAAGDEDARQHLIQSNLLLVVSIAKEFAGFGLEFPDLIALGNVGLMRAVDRFDPTRGAKLSTYASWWIKQSIRRGLTDGATTIRVPAFRHQQVRELMKAQRALSDKLQRDPTREELARHMGLSQEQIKDRFQAAYVRHTTPLDAPFSADSSGGEGASLYDTLSDPTVVATSDAMIRAEQYLLVRAILGDRKALETVAETLRPIVVFYQGRFDRREIDILTKRFGLGNASGRAKTLEEIGVSYHVTRERIRQLEARALHKFKRAFEHIDKQRDLMVDALVLDAKKERASAHS